MVVTASPPRLQQLDAGLKPRLETLLAAGRAAGADLVEVFLERIDHIGVLAEQDGITSVSPAFGTGAGLRVFRGLRDGFVSTNDLSEAGLLAALEQALGMLGLELSDQTASGFEGLPALRDHGSAKGDWLGRCPDLSEATGQLLEGTRRLEQVGRHLQVRRGSYSRDWQEVLVA
ncbi:MAG: PmbA/TldA family metallopeptidase, partial [Prochlorococcaceae cyanobacterium]